MFYLYTEVKGAFIIYGPGGGRGVNQRGGAKISQHILRGMRIFFSILFGRGNFFSTHYFCDFFFRKNYITRILILVGALQQHKGMFLKHGRGGGAKIFLQCPGGGAIFSRVFSRGGGRGAFFLAYWFCQTTTPPPAINNERSLSHFCLFTNKCGWSIGKDVWKMPRIMHFSYLSTYQNIGSLWDGLLKLIKLLFFT